MAFVIIAHPLWSYNDFYWTFIQDDKRWWLIFDWIFAYISAYFPAHIWNRAFTGGGKIDSLEKKTNNFKISHLFTG